MNPYYEKINEGLEKTTLDEVVKAIVRAYNTMPGDHLRISVEHDTNSKEYIFKHCSYSVAISQKHLRERRWDIITRAMQTLEDHEQDGGY